MFLSADLLPHLNELVFPSTLCQRLVNGYRIVAEGSQLQLVWRSCKLSVIFTREGFMATEYPAYGPSASRSTVKANDLLVRDDVVVHCSARNFLKVRLTLQETILSYSFKLYCPQKTLQIQHREKLKYSTFSVLTLYEFLWFTVHFFSYKVVRYLVSMYIFAI